MDNPVALLAEPTNGQRLAVIVVVSFGLLGAALFARKSDQPAGINRCDAGLSGFAFEFGFHVSPDLMANS